KRSDDRRASEPADSLRRRGRRRLLSSTTTGGGGVAKLTTTTNFGGDGFETFGVGGRARVHPRSAARTRNIGLRHTGTRRGGHHRRGVLHGGTLERQLDRPPVLLDLQHVVLGVVRF